MIPSGDVLALAFPRIDRALLLGPGAAGPLRAAKGLGAPLERGLVHEVRVAGASAPLRIEGYAPPGIRWRAAWRRALRSPAGGTHARLFAAAWRGDALRPHPGKDQLLSLPFLAHRWRTAGVIPYPHQIAAARRVIFELGGRAILADEVGLGKTIEAGLVLHELMLRRLVIRALVLVPSGLCWQWYQELREKFDLPAELQASEWDWGRVPLLVASLDTAKRPPHREAVLAQEYDMVIVDEAHRLKNDRTRSFELVAATRTRYLLLVTATPVHNHAGELLSLVRLVSGQRAIRLPAAARRMVPDDPAAHTLRRAARSVMVRYRRSETPIPFTARHLHTVPVRLTQQEAALYADLDRLVMEEAGGGRAGHHVLAFLTLKRELCSSPHALAASLRRMVAHRSASHLVALAERAEQTLRWAKADAALRLVRRLGDEHVLLFTEYVATQRALAERLAELGRPVVLFHGQLTPMQRDWARGVFERQAPVMVSTDAGAEGVNLQFCRHVVNVDLPWNPMRIEQRIGRVHRLGQARDVHIWNLVARSTIEEYVVYLLVQKLDLFRRFVGELDRIVEDVPVVARLERDLTRLFTRAATDAMTAQQIQQALQQLAGAWQDALSRLDGDAGAGHPGAPAASKGARRRR
ncbi:SNF2-related protein [Carboxydochorda subterranea]|uniref:SNF2-related protein n=1 Tax=Carboxydichorda subterranea TaxID=3109565 RepID=A0ABZ1C0J0_9FIRM|nr:SNF2-related protein [Limnochorda sp. L945t]WRP18597.1 SNF2-related protein [Limnochorda sp. L945t]